jgi:hypothetical protein
METTTSPTTTVRSISTIAAEIRRDWRNKKREPSVNFSAKPYLRVMDQMDKITEPYFADSGKEIVMRFLCNASSWKGEVARRVKAELNAMLKN